MILRKALQARVEEEAPSQRENLFQTTCKVNGELCNLVIDGGSEANTTSNKLVDRLCLATTKHPHPYRLSWLEKGKHTGVRRQSLVSFSIGSYRDKVLCDVISMDACDILLGRPWQTDRRSIHNGYTNTYTIIHNKTKKTLHPLPPPKTETHPHQTQKETFLSTLRELGREVEGEKMIYLLVSSCNERKGVGGDKTRDARMSDLLEKFGDEFPNGLPPLGEMAQQGGLDPGESIPNKSAHQNNPTAIKEPQQRMGRAKGVYKRKDNQGVRARRFDVGDLVWIQLRKGRFPGQRKLKLMPRDEGPYRVVEWISDNACKIDLGGHHGVSATFNVGDLSPYLEDEELRAIPLEEGEDDPSRGPTQLVTLSLQAMKEVKNATLAIDGAPWGSYTCMSETP